MKSVHDEVLRFLNEIACVKVDNLESSIEKNLGITGDDADDLICSFSKKFGVDVSGFVINKYFHSEPGIFSFKSESEKMELLIRDLILAAETKLVLDLYLSEIDTGVIVQLKTNHIAFGSLPESADEHYRVCRIEVLDLTEQVSIEHGIYVPPAAFGKIMNDTKRNLNLAYGKGVNDAKFLFSLVGYGRLVSCIISDLNSFDVR